MSEPLNLELQLIYSFHRALLGAVTDNLYAVTAIVRGSELEVVGYYLGDPKSNDEWEDLSVVNTEVISDFIDELTLTERFVDVRDEPLPLSARPHCMFLRHVKGMWPNFES